MVDYNEKLVTLGNLATYDRLRGATYLPEQEALCFGAPSESSENSGTSTRSSRRALDI